ncbi:putative aspartic-type endopeptidase opsB [Teratosphaeria destructans]|uniref:Probable aspartic-type endopeptidase OPSB n=1 Tax=Teratosphaeria destructans TaxID=418781 RepID=A0A9W7W553_9PEZI|nr:putative aspartic-type endopeptidase opsB [Teratosphaeria destructans]
MKARTLAVAVAAAAMLGNTNSLQLAHPRDSSAPKVVHHTIQRNNIDNIVERDRRRLLKRASGTVQSDLDNEETLYFINTTIGTPEQRLRLHLDTGSSDLWVNTASSELCEENSDPCAAAGTYAPNSSSTYEYLNSDFNITYEDGSGAVGDYATDVVSFGGISLKNQQFGIGYSSSSGEGVIGIGYAINEAATEYGSQLEYANVPRKLVEEGYIQSNAYSLWLNDLDSSEGSILFGGVNTAKYTGSLESLPIIKEDGIYAEFIIALTAVGENGTSGSIAKNVNSPALLDSGTSLMYLPDSITQSIYNSLGAQYDSSEGAAFVSCDLANSDATIDLTFSSPTIRIAMSELVIVAGEDRGQEICILGISPAGGTTPVLGDTFLRSAYVVYDLYNNEIGLAQTDFNSTSDNILEITNSTSIPSASAVANAVTNVAVSSGGARLNGIGGTTSSSSAMPTAAIGYDQALLGALGVGVGVAAFAL